MSARNALWTTRVWPRRRTIIGRVNTLTTATPTPGPGGGDPLGPIWWRRYDPAARLAVRAAADLVRCDDVDDVPVPPVELPRTSGADRPAAWELVAAVGGLAWPDGRSDALRRTADAWRRSGAALHRAADATMAVAAVRARCQTLARAHDSLGVACAGVADDLVRVHTGIAAALTEHGLDARPRGPSVLPHRAAIDYAPPGGPVELATGWRIAAASATARAALTAFADALADRARALPMVTELCADVSRLATAGHAGPHTGGAQRASCRARGAHRVGRDERNAHPVGTMEA